MVWNIIGLAMPSLIVLAACIGSDQSESVSMTIGPGGEQGSRGEQVATDLVNPSQFDVANRSIDSGGGKLVRLFVDPLTLDPHISTDATSAQVIVELYGEVVTINKKLELAPDLAESWDISHDGMAYAFRIREDAVFHDGRPVTADDVIWSFERATHPSTESPVVDQYLADIVGAQEKIEGDAESISGLKVIDAHTLGITIDAPKFYFLAKLTYPTAFVLDRLDVDGNPKNWFRHPNGTGPFKLKRYDVGETLLLARNGDYHLGPPKFAEVEMILSSGTGMLMDENNEIHIAKVGLADRDRLLDTNNALNAEL